MTEPRRWSAAELERDAEQAEAVFREERLREPLELYSRFFKTFAPIFGDIIDRLPSLAEDPLDPAAVGELVRDGDVRTALRYLTAPPVSEDDLKTLAETTLSATALQTNAEQARRVRDIIFQILDPHRFPWISQNRNPTKHERMRAVVSSAVLVSARKVETSRRSEARRAQEDAVKTVLRDIGFTEVAPRDIPMLDAAPDPGEFCGESQLGETRADIVVRLHDGRAMAVECKVSNSAVNSFKRINHEAAGKARSWITGFGKRQTVPAAVIGGVFNPANLESAQDDGLAIIWSHRLGDLAEFIESSRKSSGTGRGMRRRAKGRERH